MQVRIVKLVKIADPSRRPARLFDHIFEALALAFQNKTEQRLTIGRHRRAYGAESRILIGNPVERIKRNHEIELIPEGQGASVRHVESKIGPDRGTEVARSESDHIPRGIDTNHRAAWNASSDRRRDLAVAASDIEHPFRAPEIEQSEHLLGHRLLKPRSLRVLSRIPFRHVCLTLHFIFLART